MKEKLKNKKILSILLILNCIFLFILLKYNYILFLFYILLNIIILQILLKVFFNIYLINYKKIINYIKCLIKRKKLKDGEIYLKKLKINTFDGSGSLTHPSVLYFQDGLNGYKYWMVHTPYENNNVELENPCICVSNDGINFIELDGVKNPLLPIIKRKKENTYYNDPFLLYTDKLEIWYRYTIESDELINDVYRITSLDGIKWTEPELMIKNDGLCYMSLSIVFQNNIYYMYYFNTNYKLYCKKSKDLKKWEDTEELFVEGFDGKFWHGEVKIFKDKLYLLFMSKEYKLYLATKRKHEKNFTLKKELKFNYYDSKMIYGGEVLYKSSILFIDDYIYYYIPFRVNCLDKIKIGSFYRKKWTLTLTKEKNNV